MTETAAASVGSLSLIYSAENNYRHQQCRNRLEFLTQRRIFPVVFAPSFEVFSKSEDVGVASEDVTRISSLFSACSS